MNFRKMKMIAVVFFLLIISYLSYQHIKYEYIFDNYDELGGKVFEIGSVGKVIITDKWKKEDILFLSYDASNAGSAPFGYAIFKKSIYSERYKLITHFEYDGSENYEVLSTGSISYIAKIKDGKVEIVNTELGKKRVTSIVVSVIIVIVILFIIKISNS